MKFIIFIAPCYTLVVLYFSVFRSTSGANILSFMIFAKVRTLHLLDETVTKLIYEDTWIKKINFGTCFFFFSPEMFCDSQILAFIPWSWRNLT